MATKSRGSARRTNEGMWKGIVASVRRGAKGGRPGEWSARKAQLAVAKYKARGGGYVGRRSRNNSLARWTRQRWRTKSGRPSVVGPGATGERYLPEAAIRKLSSREYAATTRAKRGARGQYSRQPRGVARKVRRYR